MVPFVRPRFLLPTLTFAVCCGVFSPAEALSPKRKDDLTSKNDDPSLPSSQEATEESVLPEEPTLSAPTPPPLPENVTSAVQPLPSAGISQPSGPTVDEQRKAAEAFRSVKTEAEEQFSIAYFKIRATAAATEREKRALLREYYQAIEVYISKTSPALKDKAAVWSFQQQNRLSRSRTEPDDQPPARPASLAAATPAPPDATRKSTSEQKVDFLPSIDR